MPALFSRVQIPLRPAEADALRRLADEEDRHPRDQALRLVKEGLRRYGVLEDVEINAGDRREMVATP